MTTRLTGRPDQLPRAAEARGGTGLGLLALLGSLVLLIGVPVALVTLVGNPLPTTAPSLDWLQTQVTPELVINAVAIVVWIVWAHFVVCFLAEWQAVRSGRMPANVLFGGGSQLLARQLVATILLLAGGASVASGVAAATAAPVGPTGGERTTVVAEQSPTIVEADVVEKRGDKDLARGQKKITTVKPPQGRHHDSLWGIAERVLGDGFRYKEIYELNKDRLMPDGRRLTDADLIQPGWQLVLPADAKGPDVHLLHEESVPAGPRSGASGATDTVQPDGGAGDLAGDRAVTDGASGAGGVGEGGSTPVTSDNPGLIQLLLGGGLILAGVLRALSARRGPFGATDPDVLDLAAAADADRSHFLDQALRSLAEQRAGQRLPMPDLRFAYVDSDQLVLHLLTETESAGAPWTTAEDDRVWTLAREDLVLPGAGAAAPYPSLVNVAETHGFDVLVDLETAPGLVSVAGHSETARDVATSLALDLATHRWSDGVQVFLVGFAEHAVDVGTDRVQSVASLGEVLAQARTTVERRDSVLERLGVQGVLQGRQRGAAEDCAPVVVVMSGPPTSDEAQQIAALTADGRTSFSAVCVGDSPSARWRLVVDRDGRLEATALGISGTARRITVEAQREIVRLLADAEASRSEAAELLENTAAAVLAEDVAVTPSSPESVASSPVRVRLLGPVEVDGAGEVDAARRAQLTELVVMTALHPEGLHRAVLSASLWPRGVEADVVDARIGEAGRWLGATADGRARLAVGSDGRVHLASDVAVDHAALVGAAGRGHDASSLLAALRLGHGEVFSGVSYSWMVFAREARACRLLVTSVARRAAELSVAAGRRADAEEALTLGLRMVPVADPLWRLLVRLHSDGDPSTLARTISDLRTTFREHGARPEAETEALISELVPPAPQAAGG